MKFANPTKELRGPAEINRMPPLAAYIRSFLLGTERRQALRASQSLLVLVIYVAFSAVQHVEVVAGLIHQNSSWPLTAWNIVGGLTFFALIRSRLNLRLKVQPALTVPQMLWAMVGISWSYAITGAARGAVILIMMVLILYSVFELTAAESRRIAALGISMLAVTMAWKGWIDPQTYDPRVEVVHLIFTIIVLAAVLVISVRIGNMRVRLLAQRGELQNALKRIQSLATLDDLTGLLNRRAVLERLQIELRARDAEQPIICIAMIDLDYFKRVNDTYGHTGGDLVLRGFAESALKVIRASDVLARWGGEEFLLIIPGADLEQGLQLLERIRQSVSKISINDADTNFAVTFSAGVAVCSAQSEVERAIERADALMYRAKANGRNCSMAEPALATTENSLKWATISGIDSGL